MKSRCLLVGWVSLATWGAAAVAHGTLLWDQGMTTGTYGGFYGNTTAGQNWADRVFFSGAVSVQRYVHFTTVDPSAISGTMRVKVLSDSAGLPGGFITTQDVSVASSSALGGGVFQLNLDLASIHLAAGYYWFGASGNDMDIPQVVLRPGPNDSSSALFSGNTFSNFSSDFGDQAFQLIGSPVPEPFTLGLAGMALLAAARRRRA